MIQRTSRLLAASLVAMAVTGCASSREVAIDAQNGSSDPVELAVRVVPADPDDEPTVQLLGVQAPKEHALRLLSVPVGARVELWRSQGSGLYVGPFAERAIRKEDPETVSLSGDVHDLLPLGTPDIYASWTRVPVGTIVHELMVTEDGRHTIKANIQKKLVALTKDEAIIEVSTKIASISPTAGSAHEASRLAGLSFSTDTRREVIHASGAPVVSSLAGANDDPVASTFLSPPAEPVARVLSGKTYLMTSQFTQTYSKGRRSLMTTWSSAQIPGFTGFIEVRQRRKGDEHESVIRIELERIELPG